MNPQTLQKKYFDEKVYLKESEEQGQFDIQVNEQRCGEFKQTGQLCDLCFNEALLEKIQEYTSLERLDFVNYQINKYKDPLDWLIRFRAFLYDNSDNFDSFNYSSYQEFLNISEQGIKQLTKKNSKDKPVDESDNVGHDFINQSRIDELKQINSNDFDLSRLVRICEELNINYINKSYVSVILLTRTIIDHIPPIFGQKNFGEVYGNYGTRSFKEHMTHLDKSMRKIADSYLHTHIRKSETIPTINQVNFSQDIDVLLAEVCRHLNELPKSTE
jgi:hypothetical protein